MFYCEVIDNLNMKHTWGGFIEYGDAVKLLIILASRPNIVSVVIVHKGK